MLINSLFLSKLFNFNSEQNSTENFVGGFSRLFSEIIKVKSDNLSASELPDAQTDSLVDHKTIFISNNSILEDKNHSLSKVTDQYLNELYKYFIGTKPDNHSINQSSEIENQKVYHLDKDTFIKSIQSIIKKILDFSVKEDNSVEFKYVTNHKVESKKVTKENLETLAEFISKLIESNPDFSFVVNANSRQILFDVQNQNFDSSNINSVNITDTIETELNSSQVQVDPSNVNKINETVHSDSTDEQDQTFEVNKNFHSQTTNSSKVASVDKQNPNKTMITEKLSKVDGVNFSQVKNLTTDNLNIENTTNPGNNFQNANKVSVETELKKTNMTKPVIEIIEESDGKFSVAKPDSNGIKISDKQIFQSSESNFDDFGEVKIFLKNKSTENVKPSFSKNHFTIEPGKTIESTKELSSKGIVYNELNESTDNKPIEVKLNSKFHSGTITENTDFNKHINNEPSISRAKLPLIADYQDWDLLFEKVENQKPVIVEDDNTSVFRFSNESQHLFRSHKKYELLLGNSSSEPEGLLDERNSEIRNIYSEETFKSNEHSEPEKKPQMINNIKGFSSADKHLLQTQDSEFIKSFSSNVSVNENPKTIFSNTAMQNNVEPEIMNSDKINSKKNQPENTSEKEISSDKTLNENKNKITSAQQNKDNKSDENFFERKENKTGEPVKVSDQKQDKSEVNLKSEMQLNPKEIYTENRAQLLTSKNIIEHFVKNPYESRTLEKFIQVIEKQEVIQKSEITSYNKINHSVELKLKPEELGTIKVLLGTNDNNVNAKIEVSNEQTKAIVLNNLPQLKESLQQQGINLNNVNVSVDAEEHKQSEQTKNKMKKKSSGHNTKIENNIPSNDRKEIRNLGYNTYEYLA